MVCLKWAAGIVIPATLSWLLHKALSDTKQRWVCLGCLGIGTPGISRSSACRLLPQPNWWAAVRFNRWGKYLPHRGVVRLKHNYCVRRFEVILPQKSVPDILNNLRLPNLVLAFCSRKCWGRYSALSATWCSVVALPELLCGTSVVAEQGFLFSLEF